VVYKMGNPVVQGSRSKARGGGRSRCPSEGLDYGGGGCTPRLWNRQEDRRQVVLRRRTSRPEDNRRRGDGQLMSMVKAA